MQLRLTSSFPTIACVVLLAATGRSQLQTVAHVASLPPAAIPMTGMLVLPKFDRGLGALHSATLVVRNTHSGTAFIENLSASSQQPALGASASVMWTAPSVFVLPQQQAHGVPTPVLAAYDGVLDYAGPSGAALPIPVVTESAPYSIDTAGFAAWSSAPGAGGTVSIQVDVDGAVWSPGSPQPPTVQTSSGATIELDVTVLYSYYDGPTRLCSNQQIAWNACPCGNSGSADNGCANSLNATGGGLDVVGAASLAADTLQLVGTGMTNGSVLYFQGTDYSNAGSVFGDGRRCATGTVTRIATRPNSGGASSYPGPGDASISTRGGVAAPGMRTYQAYYRDLGNYCTPATFNVTNALLVRWNP